MRKLELLIPAGSLDVLKTAVIYGADAVYLGGEAFGLRAKAKNFTNEEIKEGIAFAHERGVKVYITANILAHNDDLPGVEQYFEELKEVKPDALIISDPGVFAIAKKILPDMELHISTQANNTNYGTYFVGRDANQGACTHPCRWKYSVVEETRPGEYMPVYENERGTYIFNSKDLCMIEHIPEMIDAGIDSFKIEGRMKTALYVATVARTYRKAIDDYLKSPELYRENMEWYKSEIGKCTYREFTTGFYFHKPDAMTQIYDSNTYVKNYTYLGTVEAVREDGLVRIEQKNKFSVGETVGL